MRQRQETHDPTHKKKPKDAGSRATPPASEERAPTRQVYRGGRVEADYARNPDAPEIDEATEGVRINKYLAARGVGSRRAVDRMIDEGGRILVNGKPAEHGLRIRPDDEVTVDGRLMASDRPDKRYIILHKPVGIECTMDRSVPDNLADYLNVDTRIFPVGRLDKSSSGLLLLTNDGSVFNPILRTQFAHEKVYEVRVDHPITDAFCRRMAEGVEILDRVTLPAKVEPTGRTSFRITLTQGLNRQIRRMCEALGYRVTDLKRVRLLHLTIDQLAPGAWRDLTQEELDELRAILKNQARKIEAARDDLEGDE